MHAQKFQYVEHTQDGDAKMAWTASDGDSISADANSDDDVIFLDYQFLGNMHYNFQIPSVTSVMSLLDLYVYLRTCCSQNLLFLGNDDSVFDFNQAKLFKDKARLNKSDSIESSFSSDTVASDDTRRSSLSSIYLTTMEKELLQRRAIS